MAWSRHGPQFFCTPPSLPLPKDNPTWMGLESIMLIEISQTQKDKHCMHHLYMKPKKAKLIKTKQNGGYQLLGMVESGRCCSKAQTFS